jgi:hypothetical protein
MYPRYVTVLGERRMRKEGTDVGWRLRADLHYGGDPSGLPLRCHPQPRKGIVAEPHHEGYGPVLGAQGGLAIASQCVPRGGPAV